MSGKKAISITLCLSLLLTLSINLSGCGKKKSNDANTTASTVDQSTDIDTGAGGSLKLAHTVYMSGDGAEMTLGKPVLATEKDRKKTTLDWKPSSFAANAMTYTVSSDLSNISNLNQFPSLTAAQKSKIAENDFVISPTDQEQLYYIYENNQYANIPSFISTDSVLQVYHIFFDYSLRTVEYEKLLATLEKLNDHMLVKSICLYDNIKNPEIKKAAAKNIAYFAVAQKLLGKKLPQIPNEALQMAEAEYQQVLGEGGFQQSAIFPFELDYSQYKPRGHYTRNDDFKRYFKAMMWYGQVQFPLDKADTELTEQEIQAILMTYAAFMSSNLGNDAELWNSIYDPTNFFVGSSDDINIYQFSELISNVYGSDPNLEDLNNKKKVSKFNEEVEKLPEPLIKNEFTTVKSPSGKQFRFMGQRYIPDSEILQKLSKPIKRPFPKGLDIMGVLGSERAKDLLFNKYQEDKKWDEYPKKFDEMQTKFSNLSAEKWKSNLYYGWMWVLKSFTNTFGKGYPSFMTTQAWQDKSLNTALGSWAELRHDTLLYGKQSGAECGGGEEEEPPVVRSYVEPNIEVYEKLLWLAKYTEQNLTDRQILPEYLKEKLVTFQDLLQFLINCSVKELRNEELTREEYDELLTFGGRLEGLTMSMADGDIISDTDRNMAVVADVHTTPGWYLEEGVGPASEILVAVPIGGKLYLTRGATFSYYEFQSSSRLTDEEWQQKFKNKTQPSLPDWLESILTTDRITSPSENEYYSSGC